MDTVTPFSRRVLHHGRRIFARHTTVVAYLALAIASSGAAYAAGIGSADIINNSIKSVDLKDGAAVKGIDVVNNSLTGADIDESSLSSSIARGTGVRILANRLVLADGLQNVPLLELEGLGALWTSCSGNVFLLYNPPSSYVDYWENRGSTDGRLEWHGNSLPDRQFIVGETQVGLPQLGDTLIIGQGGLGGPVRTATVSFGLARGASDGPCGVQATATIWTTP